MPEQQSALSPWHAWPTSTQLNALSVGGGDFLVFFLPFFFFLAAASLLASESGNVATRLLVRPVSRPRRDPECAVPEVRERKVLLKRWAFMADLLMRQCRVWRRSCGSQESIRRVPDES